MFSLDKNALLKRAKEEADKEIAGLRAAREAQFQEYVKSVRSILSVLSHSHSTKGAKANTRLSLQ